MTHPRVHTVYRSDCWANKIEGEQGTLSLHGSRYEAVRHGQAHARNNNTEHVIHEPDGTVAERIDYEGPPGVP